MYLFPVSQIKGQVIVAKSLSTYNSAYPGVDYANKLSIELNFLA